MESSGIPVKYTLPWAVNAGATYINTIPTTSQIPTNPGFASLNDGFVPLNSTPVAAGGIPPRIQDWNGILKQVTQWQQWSQAGGAITYDAAFQAAIGGYPNGAVVMSAVTAGLHWRSTVDNNTTNPDASGAGWTSAILASTVSNPFSYLSLQSATFTQSANLTTTALVPHWCAPAPQGMPSAAVTLGQLFSAIGFNNAATVSAGNPVTATASFTPPQAGRIMLNGNAGTNGGILLAITPGGSGWTDAGGTTNVGSSSVGAINRILAVTGGSPVTITLSATASAAALISVGGTILFLPTA